MQGLIRNDMYSFKYTFVETVDAVANRLADTQRVTVSIPARNTYVFVQPTIT